MRQPHPELNFRLGKGKARERRRAFSGKSLLKTMRFLGMQDDEIKEALTEMKTKEEPWKEPE